MFCTNCGKENQDGMRFCQYCGTPLTQGQPAPQPDAYVPQMPMVSPVMQALKRLASSPLYITAAVAYSCAILFNVLGAVTGGNANLLSYLSMLNDLGVSTRELDYALGSVMGTLGGVSLVSVLLGQVPSILVAVGIWMVFAGAVDRSGRPMQTGGLTLIRVIQIISLVGQILLVFLLEILLIAATVGISRYSDDVVPVMVTAMVLVILIMGLGILYSFKLVQTLGTMQRTIRTQKPLTRISGYVAVLAIVVGVFTLLTVLVAGGFFSALAILCSAVASICFGVFLFQYRSSMQDLKQTVGGVSQPAPAPQPAPQPYCEPQPTPAPQPAPQPYYEPQPAPAPQPAPQPYCEPQPAPAPQPAPQPYYEPQPAPAPQPAPQPYCEPQPAPAPQPAPQPYYATQPVVVGETEVLQKPQETTVLKPQPMIPTVRLIRVKDNAVIMIDRPQFRIGRDPGVADYIVMDNTAVGRQHADIVQHGGEYYVVDLNSTNHTYVNGCQVCPGSEYPLQNGDQLMLGDECFRVEMN